MTSGRVGRFSSAVAIAAAIGLCLSGCSADGDDRPVVIVSTNILGDVVQQLVGDEADVVTLMKPNADPHSFEISAQEGARLRTADLIVSNGLGLEEGLQQHLDEATAAALGGSATIPISSAWACCILVTSCTAVLDYERAFEWCDRIAEFAERYGSRSARRKSRPRHVLRRETDDYRAFRDVGSCESAVFAWSVPGRRPDYERTERAVGVRRVTLICSRSSISGILGAISLSQVSLL